MEDIPTGQFVTIVGGSMLLGLLGGMLMVKLFGSKPRGLVTGETNKSQEIYSLVQELDRVRVRANELYHQNSPVSRVFSITWARIADRYDIEKDKSSTNYTPGRISALKLDLNHYLERGRLPKKVGDEIGLVSELKYDVEKGLKESTKHALSGGLITEEQKQVVDSFSDDVVSVLERVERKLNEISR